MQGVIARAGCKNKQRQDPNNSNNIQGVPGGIVNIFGGGSMDYSE